MNTSRKYRSDCFAVAYENEQQKSHSTESSTLVSRTLTTTERALKLEVRGGSV